MGRPKTKRIKIERKKKNSIKEWMEPKIIDGLMCCPVCKKQSCLECIDYGMKRNKKDGKDLVELIYRCKESGIGMKIRKKFSEI